MSKLINCKSCKNKISVRAYKCPKCGTENYNDNFNDQINESKYSNIQSEYSNIDFKKLKGMNADEAWDNLTSLERDLISYEEFSKRFKPIIKKKNLTKCKTCGKKISSVAEICPNCGGYNDTDELRNLKQKKNNNAIISFIISSIFIFILAFHCELGISLGWLGDCSYQKPFWEQ